MSKALNDAPKEVASLLVPMHGQSLLVPNVSVAEIIDLGAPVPESGKAAWFVGRMNWRGLNIPLLSFEGLNGHAVAQPDHRARVVVFNNVTGKVPFYALISTGIPRLVRVRDEDITAIDAPDKGDVELHHVSVEGEAAVIPDMDKIEQWLSE